MNKHRGSIGGPLLVLLAGIGLLVLLIWVIKADREEQRQWEAFAQAHHCKVTQRMEAVSRTAVGPVVGANGQVSTAVTVSTDPAKVAFSCDDGITYWRNE